MSAEFVRGSEGVVKMGRRAWKQGSMHGGGPNPREQGSPSRRPRWLGCRALTSTGGSAAQVCLTLRDGRHCPTGFSKHPKCYCQLCYTQLRVLLELWGPQAWGAVFRGLGK